MLDILSNIYYFQSYCVVFNIGASAIISASHKSALFKIYNNNMST